MNNRNTEREMRRILPFITEFVRFSAGFAVILAIALLALHFVSAAQ